MSLNTPAILQIIPKLDTGGAELTTVEMTAAITRAGGIALVITQGGRLASQIVAAGGEIIPLNVGSKNPLSIIKNAFAIARIAKARNVSLLHVRSRAPAWSTFIASRLTGLPMLATYHGAYSEKGPFKRWYNSVMARGDAVIANSRYTAGLIRTRYGTPESRVRVIHRGVDLVKFNPETIKSERISALRKAWNIGPDQHIVLHPARLTSWKGQHVVIKAAEILKRSGTAQNAVFVLAGDSQGRADYLASLSDEISQKDMTTHFRVVGHVDDMPAAFATSHVSLIASTEPEAFGRTAAESQAMGCPVIATAIGAPPETVLAAPHASADNLTGWLVPAGDADALSDAIAAAFALSAEQRANLSARARYHVAVNFDVSRMQRDTLAYYDDLLKTQLVSHFDAASETNANLPAWTNPHQLV